MGGWGLQILESSDWDMVFRGQGEGPEGRKETCSILEAGHRSVGLV
jgi:hypothetical protein